MIQLWGRKHILMCAIINVCAACNFLFYWNYQCCWLQWLILRVYKFIQTWSKSNTILRCYPGVIRGNSCQCEHSTYDSLVTVEAGFRNRCQAHHVRCRPIWTEVIPHRDFIENKSLHSLHVSDASFTVGLRDRYCETVNTRNDKLGRERQWFC
jgi:hypothetical protein